MELLILFAASFLRVFVRAFQQRNVSFLNYAWVPQTSLVMTATEVYILVYVGLTAYAIAQSGELMSAIAPLIIMWLGNSLGCMSGMYIHDRYISNGRRN